VRTPQRGEVWLVVYGWVSASVADSCKGDIPAVLETPHNLYYVNLWPRQERTPVPGSRTPLLSKEGWRAQRAGVVQPQLMTTGYDLRLRHS